MLYQQNHQGCNQHSQQLLISSVGKGLMMESFFFINIKGKQNTLSVTVISMSIRILTSTDKFEWFECWSLTSTEDWKYEYEQSSIHPHWVWIQCTMNVLFQFYLIKQTKLCWKIFPKIFLVKAKSHVSNSWKFWFFQQLKS